MVSGLTHNKIKLKTKVENDWRRISVRIIRVKKFKAISFGECLRGRGMFT